MLNNLGLVSNLVNSELITENSLKTGQDKKKKKERKFEKIKRRLGKVTVIYLVNALSCVLNFKEENKVSRYKGLRQVFFYFRSKLRRFLSDLFYKCLIFFKNIVGYCWFLLISDSRLIIYQVFHLLLEEFLLEVKLHNLLYFT